MIGIAFYLSHFVLPTKWYHHFDKRTELLDDVIQHATIFLTQGITSMYRVFGYNTWVDVMQTGGRLLGYLAEKLS
jgi:hypothetical protein